MVAVLRVTSVIPRVMHGSLALSGTAHVFSVIDQGGDGVGKGSWGLARPSWPPDPPLAPGADRTRLSRAGVSAGQTAACAVSVKERPTRGLGTALDDPRVATWRRCQ